MLLVINKLWAAQSDAKKPPILSSVTVGRIVPNFSEGEDAKKFTCPPPRGTVTMCAYACDHQIWIDTENAGTPIADSVQARILEPFFTTKPKGAGLGLSIARNIARAHGGDLLLTSNRPKKSASRFLCWFEWTSERSTQL
jgi:nitrogen fixation/metabolism regulation signal transduction histidine kinase